MKLAWPPPLESRLVELVHQHRYDFKRVASDMTWEVRRHALVGRCALIDSDPFTPSICRIHFALQSMETARQEPAQPTVVAENTSQTHSVALPPVAVYPDELFANQISIFDQDSLEARIADIMENVHEMLADTTSPVSSCDMAVSDSDEVSGDPDDSSEGDDEEVIVFGFESSTSQVFNPFAGSKDPYRAHFDCIESPIDPNSTSPRPEFLLEQEPEESNIIEVEEDDQSRTDEKDTEAILAAEELIDAESQKDVLQEIAEFEREAEAKFHAEKQQNPSAEGQVEGRQTIRRRREFWDEDSESDGAGGEESVDNDDSAETGEDQDIDDRVQLARWRREKRLQANRAGLK